MTFSSPSTKRAALPLRAAWRCVCQSIFFFLIGSHANVAASRHAFHRPRHNVHCGTGTLHVVTTWSAYPRHMYNHAHSFHVAAQNGTNIQYIVINAGITDQDRADIQHDANTHGFQHLDTHDHCASSLGVPSSHHACNLNFAMQWLLRRTSFRADDVVIFADSDVIPVKLNLNRTDVDILGVGQTFENVGYLWPNLLVFWMSQRLVAALPNLDFGLLTLANGHTTDSGGRTFTFLQANPWLSVSHLLHGTHHPWSVENGVHEKMKRTRSKYESCHPSELLSSELATFMHLGSASSNWRHCPESVMAQSWNAAFGLVEALDDCKVDSVTYKSSAIEQYWLNAADALNLGDLINSESAIHSYCRTIASQNATVHAMINDSHTNNGNFDPDIFSSFVTMYECNTGSKVVKTYIEPLYGVLRDPRSFCGHMFGHNTSTMLSEPWYDRPFVLSRDAIVLGVSLSAKSNTFFDLGASVFDDGPGGASQQFFYEGYGRAGTLFDRYIAWEASSVNADKLFAGVPDDLFASYQYFNTPVEKNTSSPKFPVNVLRNVASERDFVSVKLDIDSSDIEDAVVAELSETHTAALVDEFFWEQHDGSLHDQYERLLRFRKMGIRAHAWP